MRTLILPLALAGALAGCGSDTPAEDATAVETATTSAAPMPAATAAPANAIPSSIPVAMSGRWGLVPADCEPNRADAKGLMTVTGDTLKFYESVGTLGPVLSGDANSLRAQFSFTGEGMTWQREMTLTLERGGATLVRQEYGADAAADPFRYKKCA